jgi:PIN domain nuclease of toxin-antitoxin system
MTARHATTAAQLPLVHSDPFDRMLIAQAQVENLTLITPDAVVSGYDVQLMRA